MKEKSEDVEQRRKEYLANILGRVRVEKRCSQEQMALELGVARKTVQNWEKGVSEPTIHQAISWFEVLAVSPLPYLFQYMYPDMEGISSADADEHLRQMLFNLLTELPPEGVRQLLYLFYGNHGSSPRAVLNMVTAHLQTSMRDRVTAGSVILKNYEIAQKKDTVAKKEHVQPNVELLRDAIKKGEEAVVGDEEAYILGTVLLPRS